MGSMPSALALLVSQLIIGGIVGIILCAISGIATKSYYGFFVSLIVIGFILIGVYYGGSMCP